jgi:hypothetical protein
MMAQAAVPFRVTWKVPDLAESKLTWLRRGGRDFLKVNRVVLHEMGDAYREAAVALLSSRRKLDPTSPWKAAADTYRDRVIARLRTGGGDIKGEMMPLDPRYVREKGFPRIGYRTGALLRDITKSKVTVTRR